MNTIPALQQQLDLWNSCDWFCVRLLGPLAEQQGADCAHAIAVWRTAEPLWQRRAAVVGFVNLVKRGEANSPGFTEMLLDARAQPTEQRHAGDGPAPVQDLGLVDGKPVGYAE